MKTTNCRLWRLSRTSRNRLLLKCARWEEVNLQNRKILAIVFFVFLVPTFYFSHRFWLHQDRGIILSLSNTQLSSIIGFNERDSFVLWAGRLAWIKPLPQPFWTLWRKKLIPRSDRRCVLGYGVKTKLVCVWWIARYKSFSLRIWLPWGWKPGSWTSAYLWITLFKARCILVSCCSSLRFFLTVYNLRLRAVMTLQSPFGSCHCSFFCIHTMPQRNHSREGPGHVGNSILVKYRRAISIQHPGKIWR